MSNLFNDVILQYWYLWLIVILCALYRLFRPKIKGIIGEKTISASLSSLPKDKYFLANDVMLKTEKGTTQIDHILFSVYGIYVIETKNYKGWILGNENDEYWTQNIYKNKNKFRNPIKQNYGHVKTLEKLLADYSNIKLVPIVAFSNQCDLKVKCVKSIVVYFKQIKKKVLEYSKEELMTMDDVLRIKDLVVSQNITDKAERKQHVERIHENVKNEEKQIANGICPKCGSQLVERKGKYGPFTGCSNYPKCRYILKKK